MKKTVIILVSAIIFLVVIALLPSNLLEHRTHYATGRLMLDPDTNGLYDPYFLQKQILTINNYLTGTDSRSSLAARSNTRETSFRLMDIGPVRSTRLIYIHYSGTDSNSVLCVASNAATMVVTFYSTNQPSWEVTYFDSTCFTPRSFWENVWINLENSSWWPFGN
jgi:hypothetical protein